MYPIFFHLNGNSTISSVLGPESLYTVVGLMEMCRQVPHSNVKSLLSSGISWGDGILLYWTLLQPKLHMGHG